MPFPWPEEERWEDRLGYVVITGFNISIFNWIAILFKVWVAVLFWAMVSLLAWMFLFGVLLGLA